MARLAFFDVLHVVIQMQESKNQRETVMFVTYIILYYCLCV